MKRYFVAGGAGFIGSHLIHYLLTKPENQVLCFDNFCSGKRWHLTDVLGHPRFRLVEGDIKDLNLLTEAMRGTDTVIHLASNADIAKAISQPDIDFWEGTYLTQNILEAMRKSETMHLLYTSGSGVYGDVGEKPVAEDYSPMLPISTYAASKLSGEALICSYCHLFNFEAKAFRFANVVGSRQTHGVAYDFIRRLQNDPTQLHILGDGTQSKSYIHVDDITRAVFLVAEKAVTIYDVFNVATDDYITVKEIADLVVQELMLNVSKVQYEFTGGDRGWKGDIPIVRFDLAKIKLFGWSSQYSSREALRHSIRAMIQETQKRVLL